jgi:hypothetical protein
MASCGAPCPAPAQLDPARIGRRWSGPARAAIQAWAAANAARQRFAAMLRAQPFPKAVVPVIPGILSLAAP